MSFQSILLSTTSVSLSRFALAGLTCLGTWGCTETDPDYESSRAPHVCIETSAFDLPDESGESRRISNDLTCDCFTDEQREALGRVQDGGNNPEDLAMTQTVLNFLRAQATATCIEIARLAFSDRSVEDLHEGPLAESIQQTCEEEMTAQIVAEETFLSEGISLCEHYRRGIDLPDPVPQVVTNEGSPLDQVRDTDLSNVPVLTTVPPVECQPGGSICDVPADFGEQLPNIVGNYQDQELRAVIVVADGVPAGFRFEGTESQPFNDLLGLRNGESFNDVITHIAGLPIRSEADLLAAFSQFDTLPWLTATRGPSFETVQRLFLLDLPQPNYGPSSVLLANGALTVGDEAIILDEVGDPGRVANIGGAPTTIGVHAEVGSITSYGRVELRNHAKVNGDIVTRKTIQAQAGAQVLGDSHPRIALNTPAELTVPERGAPHDYLAVEPGQSRTLGPGAYGRLYVRAGARLHLTPGEFVFRGLTLDSGSSLVIESGAEGVDLFVLSEFAYRSNVTLVDENGSLPAPEAVSISYSGQGYIALESAYSGLFYAPRAFLRLGLSQTAHRGQFVAKQLNVDPRVEVHGFALLP